MKATRSFKSSWFVFALVVAVIIGELLARTLVNRFGVNINPVTAAFVSIGLVAAVTSMIYEGVDLH